MNHVKLVMRGSRFSRKSFLFLRRDMLTSSAKPLDSLTTVLNYQLKIDVGRNEHMPNGQASKGG